MDTHRDDDAKPNEFLKQLQAKAEKMRDHGESGIAGGVPGESILTEWQSGEMHVIQRPDDHLGILRISIGGGRRYLGGDYCVFRGDREACVDLLKKALTALEKGRGQVSK